MHTIEGDFVGAESCIDLRAELTEMEEEEVVGGGHGGGFKRKERVRVIKREYPPPLPWLARTGSSPTTQMPWVMKRSYTEDGRLIITEEKAERCQFFRVRRSDRRLRLDLVQIPVPFWRRPAASDEEFVSAAEIMHGDHGGGSDAAADGGAWAAAASDAVVRGGVVFGGVAAVPPLHPLHSHLISPEIN
nr:protein PFC0760c [Ipomoea batatas]